ncbi:major facilitator superfamily domain-containing protein [Crassisporium funariophilum]|nr:major facilitator superfamily domain-containing protein [Crassisporium funariophilum]
MPSKHYSRTSSSPGPYVPQPESLILPDGAVGEEATELLQEFVHPHHYGPEETLVDSDSSTESIDDEIHDKTHNLPWWKRPSPWWLLGIMPFTSIAMAVTIAPRIEIYTMIACSVHKPDIFRQNFPGLELGTQGFSANRSSGVDKFRYFAEPGQAYNSPLEPLYFQDTVTLAGPWSKNDEDIPPNRRNLCASDPVVQAAVAKLTAVIAACMGILSCITTGWWGAFSDRYGRTRVMGISVLGLLITDFNFIFVTLCFRHIPGGYWFLVVGPIIEGFLGGMTSGVAAFHAYMADTTTENNRSRVFSLSLGLLFTGMALGPTLGSLLIRFTGQTLSVFFVAASMHVLYAFLVWFIIPESLPKKHMALSKTKYADALRDTALDREQNPAVSFLVKSKRIFAFLSPLTIFTPEEEKLTTRNPLKAPKKDWNLTLLALGYAFTISMMGSYTFKFQYAASTFGWSTETLGYWLSLIGAVRAFFLTAILPVAIKLLKPKPMILESPVPPNERSSLLDDSSSASGSATTAPIQKTIRKEIHSSSFDLGLARASLFMDIVAYTFMGLARTPLAFTVFGALGSLGAGFSPAIQSVTLAMYARRGGTETGRLFGAMSVIQALSSQIIGPSLYGFVYMKTVASYPRTIFFVSVGTITISFFLLCLVKVPKDSEYRRQSVDDLEEPGSNVADFATSAREGTLVDLVDGEELTGGRKPAISYGTTSTTTTLSPP